MNTYILRSNDEVYFYLIYICVYTEVIYFVYVTIAAIDASNTHLYDNQFIASLEI